MRDTDGLPIPGLYLIKLVRGGPQVAAKIEHGPTKDPETGEPGDRSPLWRATINGDELPASPCPVKAGCFRIWPSGRPCTLAEYAYRLAAARTAGTPEAQPRKAIDNFRTPTLF